MLMAPGRLMIPAGAAGAGAPASLDLNFLDGSGTIDPRITPTFRAGSGTAAAAWQYDSTGALVLASHNLLTKSEEFDHANWTKTRSSITANAAVAPDGATTADKIVEDATATNTHFTFFTVTPAGSTTYTYSVFVKAAERTMCLVQVGNFVNQAQAGNAVYVNLATGVWAATDATRTKVTYVGNGWYRISSTITTIASPGNILPSVYPVGTWLTNIYSGDGTSGLYVWGAQFSVSRDVVPYVPSTTAATYGGARLDYQPGATRTNLILRSESQDNAGAWTAAQVTVTADTVTDPLGGTSADTFTENGVNLSRGTLQGVAIPTNVAQTLSVYAKAGTRSWLRLMLNTGSDSVLGWFNLATGVVGSTAVEGTGASPAVSITDAGSGWYRCALTGIPSTADSGTIQAYIRMATADSEFFYQGNGVGTLHIWGAQLELGSSATAYIATAGSAVSATGAAALKGLLIEEARTNLFLNSATGATQTCTVAAVANTLSFAGTGTITLTGTSTAGPLVGTGATNRVSLTFTPTAGSLTLTVSGTCTNVQLEAGAYATSPIVTAGSTVARAVDICAMAALGSWFSATAGTFLCDCSLVGSAASKNVLSVSDGTNNEIYQFNTTSGSAPRWLVTDGGVAQASFSTPGLTAVAGTPFRVAGAYAANDVAAAGNGGAAQVDTSATLPTVDRLWLAASGSGASNASAVWRRLRYYNSRLPDGGLSTVTAG